MPFSRNRANVALKNEPETTKTWPEATAGRSPGPLSAAVDSASLQIRGR